MMYFLGTFALPSSPRPLPNDEWQININPLGNTETNEAVKVVTLNINFNVIY